ncbi:MAG: DUF308 domain-containing protein [Lachnospiraceae bacterium]|nr:DUF308 domain-containing protein [Lachnospiraceae bacterium]
MGVVSIILGAIFIIVGVLSIFTPISTFLSLGYLIGILFFVFGLIGIIKAFRKESEVFGTVISVLAFLVGIASFFRPGSTLVFDAIILYMIAFWFLLKGIMSIMIAIEVKGESKHWYLALITGLLSIAVGIIAFIYPGVTAIAAGLMIALFFIEIGIDMIVFGSAFNNLKKAVEEGSMEGYAVYMETVRTGSSAASADNVVDAAAEEVAETVENKEQ